MVSANEPIPLDQLPPGKLGYIDRLLGRPAHVQRLEEFGFRPGVAVQMVYPGRCFIVRLGGTKVCLRPDRQTSILVRPDGTTS